MIVMTASWRKRLDARLPPLGSRVRVLSLHVGFVVDETGTGRRVIGISGSLIWLKLLMELIINPLW